MHPISPIYTEYLGRVLPSSRSMTCDIPGRFRIDDSTGTCLATPTIVGRKSPNKLMKPKVSTHRPTTLHRNRTRRMPRKNSTAPAMRSRLYVYRYIYVYMNAFLRIMSSYTIMHVT